jgi:hypothetical protein
MISEKEKGFIALGVRTAIETFYSSLHSEDDHGYTLYTLLRDCEDKIVQAACDKIPRKDLQDHEASCRCRHCE